MISQLRPSASETDKAIFTELLNKISEADSYFCCGGTMEFHNRPLSLYYHKTGPNGQIVNRLDFLLSPGDFKVAVDKLVDTCVPAPHGRGNQTVYDDSYRLAKELPQNDFSLSLEILSEAGSQVLTTISELISGRGGTESTSDNDSSKLELEPKLYKLNAYSKDGFFKPHRDTPKANNHAGTLLIGLPVAFEGGVLRVAHAEKEVKFDWGSKCSEGIITNNENGDYKLSIPWAFFFSDVEHEVLPVLSGTRVTIAYDIFATRTIIPAKSKIDTTIHTFPLSNDIYSALQNPNFLPEGAKIAIALSHAYPMPRYELTSDDVAANLKGSDAILYRDLKSLGLDVSLEAVVEVSHSLSKAYTNLQQQIPNDEYGPMRVHRKRIRGRDWVSTRVYYTSKTFTYIDGTKEYDEDSAKFESFLNRTLKAEFAGDLMWIKKPTGTFTQVGSYLAYSNQHNIAHCYAAVTFVVIIPPYGEGPRKQT